MATTYPFTTKKAAGISTGADHYENQPIDGARIAIQGIGNGPMTSDATGTPVKSPATVADNAVTTLLTPESAITITLSTTGEPVNICEVSSSMTTYFTLPIGETVTIDIANCGALYLEGVGGNAIVSFFYTLV